MKWETVGNIKGADGENIELRTNSTHIQWKATSSETWIDLVSLEDLKGPKGDIGPEGPQGPQGEQGPKGEDGASGDGGSGGSGNISEAPGQLLAHYIDANKAMQTFEDEPPLIHPSMTIAEALENVVYGLLGRVRDLEEFIEENFGSSTWRFSYVDTRRSSITDDVGLTNRTVGEDLYISITEEVDE